MLNGKYHCHMAASCGYRLLTIISYLLSKCHKKKKKKLSPSLNEKSGQWTISRIKRKQQDIKCKRTRHKKKRGDKKGESNDIPESPDKEGGGISHPRPLLGEDIIKSRRDDGPLIPLRLSFLFKKVVVCGHCPVTLSITSY